LVKLLYAKGILINQKYSFWAQGAKNGVGRFRSRNGPLQFMFLLQVDSIRPDKELAFCQELPQHCLSQFQ
jgi:hypothetical protein